jgi:hypothetical protein
MRMRPYAAAVAKQGYTEDSIRQQIVAIADFGPWLKQRRIDAQAPNSVVNLYLRVRRRRQHIRRGEPKTLERLLAVLRQKGVAKPQQRPVADNARTRIASEFRCYLLQELGSPSTLLNYVPVAEQFVAQRYNNSGSEHGYDRGKARQRIRSASRSPVESCACGADGHCASVVLSLSAAP